MGAPGAGKGTQGELLAQTLGVPRYATGDILRRALRDGTPIGREARRYMEAGELVPDDVMLGIVGHALERPESADGFILDGFPRTVTQAEGLSRLLASRGSELDAVIDLAVDDEEIMKRLAGRGRGDDGLETIRRRLEVYRAQTEPVLEWYAGTEVPILRVEGVGAIDEIQRHILDRLGR